MLLTSNFGKRYGAAQCLHERKLWRFLPLQKDVVCLTARIASIMIDITGRHVLASSALPSFAGASRCDLPASETVRSRSLQLLVS